ncbi:DNA polymerase family A-domain-containing protein [Gongronella butleri]|nr:DNA polymerase family A-domain-containing protein [Gongronella butleri]
MNKIIFSSFPLSPRPRVYLLTFHAVRRSFSHSAVCRQQVKTNAANVQLLAPELHAQVFGPYGDAPKEPSVARREQLSQQHLQIQDIWGKPSDTVAPLKLQVPALLGKDIEDHFLRIGQEQAAPVLAKAEPLQGSLPPMPSQWVQQAGWTRYDTHNNTVSAVAHPQEDALVFDVEVLVSEGHYPTMAVAASTSAWYAWLSPYLLSGNEKDRATLIPMGTDKLIVGHNVGYDRARIADEYKKDASGLKFLDTMSLHIAVAGLCSQQRPAWNQMLKKRQERQLAGADLPLDASGASSKTLLPTNDHLEHATSFFDVSSHNNLKDVVKFHCGLDMDKQQRVSFAQGSLAEIQEHWHDLLSYCAKDVLMTHKVYQVVLPKFRRNCPHPVSLAGIVEMGSSFLTVTDKWEQYLAQSSNKHKELDDMLDAKLQQLAEQAHELVDHPEKWQSDPWLSQLDWFVNPRQRKLKGSPKWYKDAYDTKSAKLKITTRSRIAPLLLRLKWQDHPLHYLAKHGWCYKILINAVPARLITKHVLQDEQYCYFKVPHKDGEDANCGNPLAKNYLDAFEDHLLTSEYPAAREALELNATSAYWISSRERILGQFVVWDDNGSVDLHLPSDQKYGMILPQMVTMGTVTRRAVERTWLTASNAKKNRIGSELKSMVQAPQGYKIIGADVDSEELWISSVIGDAQFGFHGATALGWMTLQGTKADGTDLHSRTAAILGISRDKAKIFNYARIYGAGVKYATSLLLQYSQGMDPATAKERALDLYANTKGEKEHRKSNPFGRLFWHGGSESYMFNALEDIALSSDPRTPVLGCAITDALKPRFAKDQFTTSRINWVVQSSGVDYLHLLLVSMNHLIDRYAIDARFMLSVHDEVRYLVAEHDQYRASLALQVANLWTRALFSHKLGIPNLPQSVAFFSAVDIDHVLRKEPTMACTTPSHQEPIHEGMMCTIQDTLRELAAASPDLDPTRDCLLGTEHATPASSMDKPTLDIATKPQPLRLADEPFLSAQMYKDYRAHVHFPDQGGKETEERVTAAPRRRVTRATTTTSNTRKKKQLETMDIVDDDVAHDDIAPGIPASKSKASTTTSSPSSSTKAKRPASGSSSTRKSSGKTTRSSTVIVDDDVWFEPQLADDWHDFIPTDNASTMHYVYTDEPKQSSRTERKSSGRDDRNRVTELFGHKVYF